MRYYVYWKIKDKHGFYEELRWEQVVLEYKNFMSRSGGIGIFTVIKGQPMELI